MAAKNGEDGLTIELLALCDSAFLSKGENKLNIIGIFDIFGISQVPTRWPKMSLVAIFKGNAGSTYSVNVKISSPEKEILSQNFPVKLGENGRSNFITTLNNFPLDSFGEYRIVISEGKREIGEYKFTVIKRKVTPKENSKDLVN